MSSRALFVLGGFGLGNATRCAALIERLHAKGMTIDVATSSNGLWYFSGSPFVHTLSELEPIAYSGKNGRISVSGTLLAAPRLLSRLARNMSRIWKLQKRTRYSFIAVDSEYSCFLLKGFLSAPLLAINNVFFTLSLDLPHLVRDRRLRVHEAIEHLDRLIQTRLSDFRIAPVLDPEKVLETPAMLFCPPLVRSGLPKKTEKPGTLARALVVASGSGLGISKDTVEILSQCPEVLHITVIGMEGVSRGKVEYRGRQKEISADVAQSDFIVTNAGFSTISEAILSRRPLLLLPIPHHFEQARNARFIEAAGLGVITTNGSLRSDISKLSALTRGRSPGAPNEPRSEFKSDGAELAANYLCGIFKSGQPGSEGPVLGYQDSRLGEK